MAASDVRSVPDRILNLYLYPLAAWGIALLALYFTNNTPWAILACYPLAVWNGALTIYWAVGVMKKLRADEIEDKEADAGVRSIGHILAAGSLSPGLVWLAADPLSPQAVSTTVGVVAVAAFAWLATTFAYRMSNRFASTVALTVACLATPINATGAVTMATLAGMYDVVSDAQPVHVLPDRPGREPAAPRDRKQP